MRVRRQSEQALHCQAGHALIGRGQQESRDRHSARKLRRNVQQNDGVELVKINFLPAQPLQYFLPRGVFDPATAGGMMNTDFVFVMPPAVAGSDSRNSRTPSASCPGISCKNSSEVSL